jgi:predicted patatin/cPLA2 family phospholipase
LDVRQSGDDYSPGYFSPQKENWLDIIRASSAIPGFYRTGALLDGISYLDGGISDAVPVQEAARRGAKTIVVIRTVPSQMYYTPQWFKRMERWLGDSSLQPLVNIAKQHETTYGAMQRFIEKPPGKLRIFEIYPLNRCSAWRWAAASLRCAWTTKRGGCADATSWRRSVRCWRSNRLCIGTNPSLRPCNCRQRRPDDAAGGHSTGE